MHKNKKSNKKIKRIKKSKERKAIMKRTVKQICCLILSFTMIVSMVYAMAACSVKQDSGDKGTSTSVDKTSDGSGSDTSETSQPETTDEPVEISIIMSGDNTPAEDNIVLQELGKRTNTIIKITYVPGSDLATKKKYAGCFRQSSGYFSDRWYRSY
jgi:hypothetical protein